MTHELSAPVHQLKRRARLMSRRERIPLHEALDRIARAEGFRSWSLLAHRVSAQRSGRDILAALAPGDLVLVAARPGHGKTLLGLELAIEAMKAGRRAAFFTLAFTATELMECFPAVGEKADTFRDAFLVDDSDDIDADHVIRRLASMPGGSVVVIDYLQLLDQRRDSPDLAHQIVALKSFAADRGLVMVFISQIRRRFESAARGFPGLTDVHLPNPLDLEVFDKACFMNDGEVRLTATA